MELSSGARVNGLGVRGFRHGWMGDETELYIFQKVDGHRAYCSNVTLQTVEEGVSAPPSPIVIDATAAQVLMDDLWNCGVRPTEGTGSAGQSLAQQNHIKDLQTAMTRLFSIVEKSNV